MKFYTPIGCLSHIGHQFSVTCVTWNIRRYQQIFDRIPVHINRTAKAFFKETEVNTNVTCDGGFPFHIRIVHIFRVIKVIVIVADFSPSGRTRTAYSIQFLIKVGIDAVVTGRTVA